VLRAHERIGLAAHAPHVKQPAAAVKGLWREKEGGAGGDLMDLSLPQLTM
jgi:hypothetical protein